MYDTGKKQETAILVGLINRSQDEDTAKEYLDELEFLVDTAGAKVLKRFTQRLEHPDSRTFIGSGKLQDVRTYVEENNIDLVIFDDELSPAQQRNLEKEVNKGPEVK